ncbi:MAG: hypothetical protein KBS52_00665 [Clostridiales bacterium]|nr:hypothetical protein [Candidatus Equinaster intestinalis]
MFCKKCGFEFNEGVEYCPQCGAQQTPEYDAEFGEKPDDLNIPFEAVPSTLSDKVTELVSSGLFLAATILATVSAVLNSLSGGIDLSILYAIFMWTAYASAKKGKVTYNNIRNISGMLFAEKIILIVSSALIGFAGIVVSLLGNIVDGFSFKEDFVREFESALEQGGVNSNEFLGELSEIFGKVDMKTFLDVFVKAIGIIAIIVAVGMLLVAIFGIGSIHKCVKTTYEGMRDGNENIQKLTACRGWLMTFGIVGCLSVLSNIGTDNITGLIAGGASAAAYIIGFVLVGNLKEKLD